MNDVCYLIGTTLTEDELGQQVPSETRRMVYCRVDSIGSVEWFQGQSVNLRPQHKLTVFFGDYDNEETVEFRGERYGVYRTYQKNDSLELYIEKRKGI